MIHHHKLSYHQPPIDHHEPNHHPLPNPLTRKKSKTKSSDPDHDHDPPEEGRHGSEIQQASYQET